MVLRLIRRVALLLAFKAWPTAATDWYHVDDNGDDTMMSFVDRDSIGTNAAGKTTASIYSVTADDFRGAAAFQFSTETDCRTTGSRVITGQVFGVDGKSIPVDHVPPAMSEWRKPRADSQGASAIRFICSKGAGALAANSFGSDRPFARARQMLADKAREKK